MGTPDYGVALKGSLGGWIVSVLAAAVLVVGTFGFMAVAHGAPAPAGPAGSPRASLSAEGTSTWATQPCSGTTTTTTSTTPTSSSSSTTTAPGIDATTTTTPCVFPTTTVPATSPAPPVAASSATAPQPPAAAGGPTGPVSTGSAEPPTGASSLPFKPSTDQQLESFCNTDSGPVLDKALVADVIYQPSKKMVLGVPTEVDAVVGFGKVSRQSISGNEPTTIVQVTASCALVLVLEGAGFNVPNPSKTVHLFGPQQQMLPHVAVMWDVTPTLSGVHDLKLEITPEDYFTTTGAMSPQDDPVTKSQLIAVTAVGKPVTHELWDFVNTPILILIITLIAGSSAFAGLFRRHRKGEDHLEVDGPPPAEG